MYTDGHKPGSKYTDGHRPESNVHRWPKTRIKCTKMALDQDQMYTGDHKPFSQNLYKKTEKPELALTEYHRHHVLTHLKMSYYVNMECIANMLVTQEGKKQTRLKTLTPALHI